MLRKQIDRQTDRQTEIQRDSQTTTRANPIKKFLLPIKAGNWKKKDLLRAKKKREPINQSISHRDRFPLTKSSAGGRRRRIHEFD